MIDDDDLSLFFDASEFARTFTRGAGTPEEVSFNGILSVNDEVSLQGFALAADFVLAYPTAAATLRKGDVLAGGAGEGLPGGANWVLREHPQRSNDGRESRVAIDKVDAP